MKKQLKAILNSGGFINTVVIGAALAGGAGVVMALGTGDFRWLLVSVPVLIFFFNGVNHLPCNDDPNRIHWLLNC